MINVEQKGSLQDSQ